MDKKRRAVTIAGAGIAGLTAALTFSRRGWNVTVRERAARLEEAGAGIQISPNATRLLAELGVIQYLENDAVHPEFITLFDAVSLRKLAAVKLGDFGLERWGAPYLTVRRADLQNALLQRLNDENIRISLECPVTETAPRNAFLVASDGVWSSLRGAVSDNRGAAAPSQRGKTADYGAKFAGYVAWRATLQATDATDGVVATDRVTALLHPRFHIVAYPVRGGREINLVVVAKGSAEGRTWSRVADASQVMSAIGKVRPEIEKLIRATDDWSAWPIYERDPAGPWSDGIATVLIGDAAHAMTPYAAQGAAMAIEDAAVLASVADENDLAGSIARFEELRRPRIDKVMARARFNRFAYHAGGSIRLGRNLVLGMRSPEQLAKDFDWLYGFDASEL